MVAVGVSGHRDLFDNEAVAGAIDEMLGTIVSAYGESDLQVISPLAEGADRLVVWRALAHYPVRLVVPLPLDLSTYMHDFPTSASQSEFSRLIEQADEVIHLPEVATRRSAYLAAGLYVLEHCQVLVAIWDGSPSQGIGGTSQIVMEARRRGMPLAWLQVARRGRKASALQSRVNQTVSIHYERFPTQIENQTGGP